MTTSINSVQMKDKIVPTQVLPHEAE